MQAPDLQISAHGHEKRAAQFLPFAALVGYDTEIAESSRWTDRKIPLSEEQQEALNQRQRLLSEHLREQPQVTVTYFMPDDKKTGGHYETVTGHLKKLDLYARQLILSDNTRIPMEEISALESPIFRQDSAEHGLAIIGESDTIPEE